MKCLILVAGYATRMYALTKEYPKPLLKVQDKAILDWLLEDLQSSDQIEEYILISNHKFIEQFRRWAQKQPVPIRLVDNGTCSNEERLGAVRDIQFAVDAAGIDDDLLVVAGDYLTDFSITHFIDFATEKHASCIMHCFEPDLKALRRGGVCELDEDGRVLSMEEKPAEPKTHFAALPFYYYTAADVRKIKTAIAEGCGTDAPGSLVSWMCRNSTVYSMEMPGLHFDVGDLESYENAQVNYPGIQG